MSQKRNRRRANTSQAKSEQARDDETVRLVKRLLSERPVDTASLRKLAAVRGLVSNKLRILVWPILLGLPVHARQSQASYEKLSAQDHRDSQVVTVDVQRSLWAFTPMWSEDKRDGKRQQLQRVLNATVAHSGGEACYYQGLHDVASVLLMVGGEAFAFRLLCHLTTCQLRDCTRPTLDAVMEQLPLVIHILHHADAQLAAHITAAGILPYFALSWYITWFAHNVTGLEAASRLFDLFMASHPLMPLYVGVIAMKAAREQLLGVGGDDPAEVHSALSKLSVLGVLTTDQLAQEAVLLMKRAPPIKLLRHRDFELQWSVVPAAKLIDGHWQVPQSPPSPGLMHRSRLWLQNPDHRREWMAAAILSGTAVIAALLAQNPQALQLLSSSTGA